uniref:Ancestral cyclohexadienyl dehydratase, AncCDT-5 n=1 Tax=synthetic construct TaxID=32630 RepID=UPI00135F185E|nr:Chain A, Ancestral cyclohexadienyl dehydratase, AncCDT-5 [synthetic construct]
GIAASRLDEIMQRGTLRVGTTGDYKPFSYRDPDGQFTGFDIDMAESLAKSLGVKVEFVPTTWPTLMDDFQADKFDIAMGGVSVTPERQKKADFSEPYMTDGKTPIVRCEDADKYQTLEQIDRPDVRVVVNPGGTNERFARAHLKQAQITVYPDNVTIFQEIVAGRADVMMTDAVETRYQQKLHPGLCAVHVDKPFTHSEKAYLLPRGDPAFKAYVDQWLHQAMQSGTYQRIFDKWLKL